MQASDASNLSEPDDLKKNSTGIKGGEMCVANISSIQQGSFDSTFDDDFVLRVKSPATKDDSEGDTGIHTFTFHESDQKRLDSPSCSDLIQIGTIKFKATENAGENLYSMRVLGFKVGFCDSAFSYPKKETDIKI